MTSVLTVMMLLGFINIKQIVVTSHWSKNGFSPRSIMSMVHQVPSTICIPVVIMSQDQVQECALLYEPKSTLSLRIN